MVSTDLVVVLRGRNRDMEHTGRDVHTVSSHSSISVGTNEAKRIMREMVVIKEIRNYMKTKSKVIIVHVKRIL